MTNRTVMVLLAGLILAAAATHADSRPHGWALFLYGLPLVLIGCLLAKQRWALMAAVMYGTVGLALDISTVVQGLTKPEVPQMVTAMSGVTGLLNFSLIVFGGKGFLSPQDL
ncbi:MAG: hypothetical protein A3K11_02090 [Nitrospirae bacterium RIFCSPLOWO2_12_FULL_63_8]|nr:MAG: hypothetical protein A3K11_02090 [Nitrospirae bacterium RIFCSPLOWO2_12_FULL_63_8]